MRHFLENYRFCRKSGNEAWSRERLGGGEGRIMLFASLWRIAYQNRYVTNFLSDLYLFMCVSNYLYLSVYLSLCLSICLSVCLSVCLSFCLSVRVSASLSVCLPVCLSNYLPAYPPVFLLVCLYVYAFLSVSLSVCLSLSVCIPSSLFFDFFFVKFPVLGNYGHIDLSSKYCRRGWT